MSLTSEVQAVVDRLEQAEVSFTELSEPEARALYIETLESSGGAPVAMAAVEDDALTAGDQRIGIRRYRPESLTVSPAPTVIYYHGGGWVLGDLDSHDRICRQLAARTGCQLIAVDYRLAPEHRLPAASEDAISAFEQLATRAPDYDIDTGRLAVAGDSAGGHLSAVVALAARDHGWPLAFQTLIYPATDMRPQAKHYPSRTRNANVPPLTLELMYWFGRRAANADMDVNDWRISPLMAKSLEGAAPALVVTVGADVLMDEGVLYAARLVDHHVPCEHAHFPGVIHGSIEMLDWLTVTDAMMDRIAGAIRAGLD